MRKICISAALVGVLGCKKKEAAPAPDPMTACGECALVEPIGADRFVRLETTPRKEEGTSPPATLHFYAKNAGLCCPSREVSLPAGTTIWQLDDKAGGVYVRSSDARWAAVASFGISKVDPESGAVTPIVSRMMVEYSCEALEVHRVAAFVRVQPKKDGDGITDSPIEMQIVTFRPGAPIEVEHLGFADDFLSVFPEVVDDPAARQAIDQAFRWSLDCATFHWRASLRGEDRVYSAAARPAPSVSASSTAH